MAKYSISLSRSLLTDVTVEANSKKEACAKALEMEANGELDYNEGEVEIDFITKVEL